MTEVQSELSFNVPCDPKSSACKEVCVPSKQCFKAQLPIYYPGRTNKTSDSALQRFPTIQSHGWPHHFTIIQNVIGLYSPSVVLHNPVLGFFNTNIATPVVFFYSEFMARICLSCSDTHLATITGNNLTRKC